MLQGAGQSRHRHGHDHDDDHDHDHGHMVHDHRNVAGGSARAAVFGISDGLVSNVALILGVAGASAEVGFVRVAGISGLIAGAVSMAAGEYVSMKAQNELVEREIEIERRSIAENPKGEQKELQAIYERRGLPAEQAERVAADLMSDPEIALDVHTREELGVDPESLGNPIEAALSSFVAFAIGALLPLLPWFFGAGTSAIIASVVIGLGSAALVGVALAYFAERPWWRSASRQVIVAAVACAVTYGIGSALGV